MLSMQVARTDQVWLYVGAVGESVAWNDVFWVQND